MDFSNEPIVAIGASAGGVESLKELVSELPADFAAPILVVLHVPAYRPSALPEILSRCGRLHAQHPQNGEKIKPGTIYVAPPDHHMLIERGGIAVAKGPKENRFRPSIDALFRSVAYSHGPRAIGIVLSGALDDGTSGLWTIKRLGGIAVVQQPSDARFESMPLSALEQVQIDHMLSAAAIGQLLPELTNAPAPADMRSDSDLTKRVRLELAIAADGNAFDKGIMEVGKLTPFTCPECHGVLVALREHKMTRYRCHTGHGYSDSALLEAVMQSTGEMLWQVMRSYEEGVMLIRHMAQHAEASGDDRRNKIFCEKADDLQARSKILHDLVQQHESLSGDNLATAPAQADR